MAGNYLNRWMKQCFVGEGVNRETSIKGSSGDLSSQYYWHKSLAHHLCGMFSMAVAQANVQNEDCSQLVSGSLTNGDSGLHGVFVGVYDGHDGTTCSQFILDHLFNNFKSAIANKNGVINAEVLQEAYHRTELMFVNHVRTNWQNNPQLAVLGSCCLVGVVFNNILYVANAGDSRAVLARWPNGAGMDEMEVIQLSVDYNAKHIERRNEVCMEHPGANLFPEVEGCFLLRGSLHVTRAIGNVYLKYNEFNKAPLPDQYMQEEPIVRPILKEEPMIQTHQLGPDDRFVIFASHGFWDEINNEEAAGFVRNFTCDVNLGPEDRVVICFWFSVLFGTRIELLAAIWIRTKGAAAMLMGKALERAASKHGIGYYDLNYFDPGAKRQYHDDISVVILFFDSAFFDNAFFDSHFSKFLT